ncbi:PREDICTED: uncharacterized protein LOC108569043 isoform X2 [Nicrophorus vespilloides]|uniref:Uncharacterized protein LOC108569043 isoform X2 n=1 Tax=Nicrophorus vespilloides TaxID=110193 RepID=A0ABM1NGH3_NICVS|nr:PREDICTED: uncharacterized protein LOC108569043 isoform X2 [Nicrophorus vespilloides]
MIFRRTACGVRQGNDDNRNSICATIYFQEPPTAFRNISLFSAQVDEIQWMDTDGALLIIGFYFGNFPSPKRRSTEPGRGCYRNHGEAGFPPPLKLTASAFCNCSYTDYLIRFPPFCIRACICIVVVNLEPYFLLMHVHLVSLDCRRRLIPMFLGGWIGFHLENA